MIPKASLYDRYRLTNSTAIPMFQGSAGPEAIQVGAHLQGLYDTAQQGGNDIASMSENIQAMPGSDQDLAKELRDHVQGTIGKYAEAKDWENRVQEVRSLGQHYINRASELAAPIKQYQEWKKSLDDKELNLTPKQKAIYDQMGLAGYSGLRKDAAGKFVGGFTGVEPAKNLDVNKRADEWIRGYVEAEGGSDITTDNGVTKYRKAGTWHILTPDRIKGILNSARQNDNEYLAYEGAEGNMEGFQVAKNIQSIKQLDKNPVLKQAVQSYIDAGYSLQEAAAKVAATQRSNSIVNTMENYAIDKYAHNNRTSTSSQEMGDVAKAEAVRTAGDLGLFGDLTTGQGIDLTQKLGSADDIETSYKDASSVLDKTGTELKALRQTIAKSLGTTEAALTDKQVEKYYVDHPADYGNYKGKVQAIAASKSSLAELNQLRETSMDLAVQRKFPGKSFNDLKRDATTDLPGIINTLKIAGSNGKVGGPVPDAIKNNLKDYEVIDGSSGGSGMMATTPYIEVKNKQTGAITKLYTVGNAKANKVASRFDGLSWKGTWKEAASNIRSNTMWMPLMNKTTPDGQFTKAGAYANRIEGVLKAGTGGLAIKDADLNGLSSDDVRDMKARISSGKFNLLGIGKTGTNGKLSAQLSVEVDAEASDPADRYKTIVVDVETNMANKMSQYAVQAGMRDKDIRTYQFGLAMAPGSGYEQTLGMSTSGRLQINDDNIIGGGKPMMEVVPNISGQASDALSYEVYNLDANGKRIGKAKVPGTDKDLTFSDAIDLGAYLDGLKQQGKSIQKKNK